MLATEIVPRSDWDEIGSAGQLRLAKELFELFRNSTNDNSPHISNDCLKCLIATVSLCHE